MAAVSAIIGAATAILSIAYPALVAEHGGQVSKDIQDLAQRLAKKLASNQALLDKAQIAYNSKNASLATEILKGSGLGSRASAIAQQAAQVEQAYKSTANKIIEENKNLQDKQQELNKASSIVGSSISGNVIADKIAQNIKGGITE